MHCNKRTRRGNENKS